MGTRSWGQPALALALMAAALVPACAPNATATAVHEPSRRTASVTLRGSLVQLHGSTLTVQDSSQQRTVRVTFVPATTPIFAVTTATSAAVQPGSCVVAGGERATTGALTTSTIVLGGSVDDTCPAGSLPDPPLAAARGLVTVRGQVVGVSGSAITVQSERSDPSVVVLEPRVQVLSFQPGDRSALVGGTCLVVQGMRTRAGIAAHQITDWPPQTVC